MDKGFAKRLSQAMEKAGTRQSELVEKTGISKGAISQYLKGEYLPKQQNTYKIAKALNTDPGWLVKGNTEEIETIAAHHDGDAWTEEELKAIEDFKAFVKSKRNK